MQLVSTSHGQLGNPAPESPSSTDSLSPDLVEETSDHSKFHTSNTQWIENDGLLRDDGAVFGTACGQLGVDGSDVLAHKLDSIRAYYRKQVADHESRRDYLQAEIARLSALHADLQAQEATIRAALSERIAKTEPPPEALAPAGGAQSLRYVLGFAFNLTGCLLLGVLVYDLLGETSLEYAQWASTGIVLLALFNVFHPISILFAGREVQRDHTHQVEPWKQHLTEWLLPVTGAAFVAVWAHQDGQYLHSATVFLLLLGAFLVSGRIVFGSATKASVAFIQGWRALRRSRAEQRETKRLHRLAEQLRQDQTSTKELLDRLREQVSHAQANILRMEQQTEEKIHLFCSEFELARLAAMQRRQKAAVLDTSSNL